MKKLQATYYHRFQLITSLFFFRAYLQWAYAQGIRDAYSLGVPVKLEKKSFSCLLCGVSGEITAKEFIQFVFSKNKYAHITIIDMGTQQVSAIKKLVQEKYADKHISVRKINALSLQKHFSPQSFDWIETDGFIEYFDKENLAKLLKQWKLILKRNGFITTRDFASTPPFGWIVDFLRYHFIKHYLTLTGYIHTKKELDRIFLEHNFTLHCGNTPLPTFRRYILTLP